MNSSFTIIFYIYLFSFGGQFLCSAYNGEEIGLPEAAKIGDEESVVALLRNGTNVNDESEENKTPLHYAAEEGHDRVVQILLKNGAEIDAKDENKLTPLHVAAAAGQVKVVELLIGKDANINAETILKEKPIHLAAIAGQQNVAKILLQNGADINAENELKETPLHLAIQKNHEQLAYFLLSAGALKDIKSVKNETAADVALSQGNQKLYESIRKYEPPAIEACRKYVNMPGNRIFGGAEADEKEFPWMAALGYLDLLTSGIEFGCGGTIISDHFVLTAAHCVRIAHSPVVIRLGTLALNDTNPANHRIKEIIRHPEYSSRTRKNDIALIRLVNKIEFNEFVLPACLQTELEDEKNGTKMIATGWGTTESGKPSNILLKTQLDTIPLEECNDKVKFYNDFTSDLPTLRDGVIQGQYCAQDPQGKNDSCIGDNGGPLQIFKEANGAVATVVGVVSFNIGCASDVPTVFTRVAFYMNWIESIVWPKL